MDFSSTNAALARLEQEEINEKKPTMMRKSNLFGLAFLVGALFISVALVANRPRLQTKAEFMPTDTTTNLYSVASGKDTDLTHMKGLTIKGLTKRPTYINGLHNDYHSGKSMEDRPIGCYNVYLRMYDSDLTNANLINGIQIPGSNFEVEMGGDGFTPDGYLEVDADIRVIEDYKFGNCSMLKIVKFLGRIDRMGEGAFENCNSLVEVIYADEQIPYKDSANDAYEVKNTRLVKTEQEIEPIAPVPTFGANAFAGCGKLISGGLLDGVTEVPKHCFYACASIDPTSFYIPQSIEHIYEAAFYAIGGSGLELTLTLPNLRTVGAYAFKNSKIQFDISQAPLSYIGALAFENTRSTPVLKLPDVSGHLLVPTKTTEINHRAFRLAGIKQVWFLGPYADYDLAFGKNYKDCPADFFDDQGVCTDGTTSVDGYVPRVAFENNRIDCMPDDMDYSVHFQPDPYCGCVFGTLEQAKGVYFQGAKSAKWCHFENVNNNNQDDVNGYKTSPEIYATN